MLFRIKKEVDYNLKLGDVLYLGKEIYMICKLQNNKIGFVDIKRYLVCTIEFYNLKQVNSFVNDRIASGDEFCMADSDEWTIYCP